MAPDEKNTSISEKETSRLFKRGLFLEYINVSYNVLEAVISIIAGGIANSIALIGFGLDSIIESLSGIVLIWRLRQHGRITKDLEERIERNATRFVALSFFILGAYILFESIKKLVTGDTPDPSLAGIIIAIASIITMPFMAWQKCKIGKQIKSRALVADSKETIACSLLSVALLLGLGLNYLFGFWQADPVVGIIIVLFLFREGWEGWHDEEAGK